MAAVGVGSKYNVALNGVGYLLRGLNYRKRDLPALTARFSTGEQGETDLDTWKTISQLKFSGIGQKTWGEDPTLVENLMCAMPDFDGEKLVPTAPVVELPIYLEHTSTMTLANPCVVTHTAHGLNTNDTVRFETTGELPYPIDAGVSYYITKIDANTFKLSATQGGAFLSTLGSTQSGTHTGFWEAYSSINPITCGSAFLSKVYMGTYAGILRSGYGDYYSFIPGLTGITTAVTDLVNAGSFLYAIVPASNKVISFDGTTWSTCTPTTATAGIVFNNKFYIVTTTGKLYSSAIVAGASLSFTDLGYISLNKTISDGEVSMCVYNHRLYISKRDGLFVYDGVVISPVLSNTATASYNNYRKMTVFNGALYWLTGERDLYRFNGGTVEHIWRFQGRDSLPYSLAAVNGRLLISTIGDGIYAYDGISVFPCANSVAFLEGVPYSEIPFSQNIVPIGEISGESTVHFGYGFAESYGIKRVEANPVISSNYTGLTYAEVITSAFDCGFPRVPKYLESVTLDVYDIQSSVVNVYYRLYSGKAWGAWQDLGDIATTVDTLYVRDISTLTANFEKIQFKFVLNNFVGETGLESFSFDYCLMPSYKREWQVSLLAVGTSESPQQLLDGTDETRYSNALRENVYSSRSSSSPVGFEDVDYTRANGAITTTGTSITVDDTNTFASSGYIKIDDEIIKYTGKSATQFTGCVRGRLGTSAATHTDNTIVNSYYRVIVSEISNEEVYGPAEGPISPAVNYNESIITVTLKEA